MLLKVDKAPQQKQQEELCGTYSISNPTIHSHSHEQMCHHSRPIIHSSKIAIHNPPVTAYSVIHRGIHLPISCIAHYPDLSGAYSHQSSIQGLGASPYSRRTEGETIWSSKHISRAKGKGIGLL